MKRRNFLEKVGKGATLAIAATSRPAIAEILLSGHLKESGQRPERPAGRMDSWLEIDLNHLSWNIAQIKRLVQVPIMAVIKANAYGHGLAEVGRFLEKQGIGWLMVGNLGEALALRRQGVRCRILNFGGFSREDAEAIVDGDISQAIWSDEVAHLHEAAIKRKKRAAIHVDIDTGMGRTGVPWTRALSFLSRLANLDGVKVEGTMTTLTEDKGFDLEQVRRFMEVCSQAGAKGISVGLRHAASSAGILARPEFHLDMVRPGIMIYGYYPSEEAQREDRLALKPVARWLARVVDIRELSPGDTLSYHRVFRASQTMRVATVGVGYSDGYPSALAGRSHVLIHGQKYPAIAAVTANHMMVDLLGDATIKIGDEVVLLDNRFESGLTADILAELAGISVYKILIGLNPLLFRQCRIRFSSSSKAELS